MIVNKSYTFWNRAARLRGRRALHLMSADNRSPAAITAPTIAHLRTNRIFFCSPPPLHLNFSPGVSPLRPVGNTASFAGFASRPVHSVFILSTFLCCSHSIEYTHIIPKRQNNASGFCALAYNVIYIKRHFCCVVFTKTACAIGYFVV